ncbi:dTDP-4-dehydrorhamnose 3,5-epimerase [Flavobacterium cyanobacteriorum]|uniref:dTDP-4-dehydrorhamnose 3,5-epimerase n=1 Tax=Flavobacterium cyanobacteriorum TaxID=2022802 RepID=A0A255YY20_9FLAO|nr:dTDP-4-dehydrorhamnose 3,5-epimerase [Flavobacterium cyanobacteriorum]OYQ33320.1 dTDP-4-dehydrorhamnose 3,5-epimerase [Flavobacterium cyanobacteriorum]
MKVTPTPLEGCFVVEPNVLYDERGYFMESFNEKRFEERTGVNVHFVQDNQSHSAKGVLRGLHYQTGEHAQAKLVRVLQGEVLDVALDIRPDSATFGQYFSVVLSSENQKQLFVPRGFAHGFLVLSETATFFYKCDNFYNKESEGGILFNDPEIAIDWQFQGEHLIISDKDKVLPLLKNSRPIW